MRCKIISAKYSTLRNELLYVLDEVRSLRVREESMHLKCTWLSDERGGERGEGLSLQLIGSERYINFIPRTFRSQDIDTNKTMRGILLL